MQQLIPQPINKQFMKKFLLVLSCFSLLCFAKCRKDKIPAAILPPATTEGKNTVGFTIDREVWVPYAKCAAFSNPCREIHVEYGPPSAPYGALNFAFTRIQNGKRSDLTISTGTFGVTISTIGDKTDSIGISYNDNELSVDGYFIGPLSGSKFIITNIDFQNQVIAGVFDLILQERKNNGTITNKIIILKDGRFDFQFNACKCSN
ncbi:MAG: hypothetical protein ACOYVG_12085 [Bacteroidota bacterium]